MGATLAESSFEGASLSGSDLSGVFIRAAPFLVLLLSGLLWDLALPFPRIRR